jgi:D-glycero-alpha-D-manno-heptose-7-phosphate kinase
LIIKARAPLRIGLAGGGTDVSPYCDDYGGLVLNTTISRYAYATIETREDDIVQFCSTDKNHQSNFKITDDINKEGITKLLQATYIHMMENYNEGIKIPLKLVTFCDSPPGSGLGTSSTLVVAMVKAFCDLLNLNLDNYKLAEIAFIIERVECGLLGGKQDQYSAAFGGFNFIEFKKSNNVIVNNLELSKSTIQELEASLLLFFTGVSRDSDKIIFDQSSNMKKKDKQAINALHNIKNEAISMKDNILNGDFKNFVKSMTNGWENKKKSSSVISNSFIEEIYNCAIDNGALAGKVSGAGGGGFMVFFVPIEKRKSVINSLEKYQGEISNTHFTKIGAECWRCN